MQINTGISLSKVGFLLCFAALVACSSGNGSSGVLPINPMKEVMWDIAQVEVYANQHLAKDSAKNLKKETLQLYQQLFAIHKTTKEQFTESLRYYEQHPDKHKILLDSLLQYANRQRDTMLKKSFQSMKPLVK